MCASLSDLPQIAKKVLETNMGMGRKSNLFILYDDTTTEIAEAYMAAARIIQYPEERLTSFRIPEGHRPLNAEYFEKNVSPLIDVCFDGVDDEYRIALTPTMQHTQETNFRIAFVKYVTLALNGRLGHQPGINKRMMTGPMNADYNKIAEDAESLYQIMKDANIVNLQDNNGSFLRIKLPGEKFWEKDDGIFHKPGIWGNLPAGELFCHPEFGFTEGVLFVPENTTTGIGVPKSKVRFTIRDGTVVEFETKDEEYLKKLEIEFYGTKEQNFSEKEIKFRMTIGELGIGLNPMAKLSYGGEVVSEMLEAEKVLGTLHIATGEGDKNPFISSESRTHCDYLIKRPTLKVDGKTIINDGVHVWKEEAAG